MNERFNKYLRANEILNSFDPDKSSISSVIEGNLDVFDSFKVIFATNLIPSSNFNLHLLEKKYPFAKSFFCGKNLFFFSKSIYQDMINTEIRRVSVDQVCTIDTNVAEKFRIWAKNGSLGDLEYNFSKLLELLSKDNVSWDGFFYFLEDYKHSLKPENNRTFETFEALKTFDYYKQTNTPVKSPDTNSQKTYAKNEALKSLSNLFYYDDFDIFFNQRNILLALLLKSKSISIKNLDFHSQLFELLKFNMENIKKFCKTEIYFCWKFFKYGKSLEFFKPMNSIDHKLIKRIRGISWDLFSFRYAEMMTSKSYRAEFNLPLFISFDDKFVQLSKACPISCMIIDEELKRTQIHFQDEQEFNNDVNEAFELCPNLLVEYQSKNKKLKRSNTILNSYFLCEVVKSQENNLTTIIN